MTVVMIRTSVGDLLGVFHLKYKKIKKSAIKEMEPEVSEKNYHIIFV